MNLAGPHQPIYSGSVILQQIHLEPLWETDTPLTQDLTGTQTHMLEEHMGHGEGPRPSCPPDRMYSAFMYDHQAVV